MSVGPVSGTSVWSPAAVAPSAAGVAGPGSRSVTPVAPHRFLPDDPANKYLTDGDRSALLDATGVDFRANGEIGCPVSMDLPTYFAALNTAGRLAADRGSGRLTGPITADYLGAVLKTVAEQPRSAMAYDASGFDLKA